MRLPTSGNGFGIRFERVLFPCLFLKVSIPVIATIEVGAAWDYRSDDKE